MSCLILTTAINQAYAQKFAVIGDFGKAGDNESDVANLVIGWDPDFIVTVGDNNYPDGEASTIDENIGQYYHAYIYPYTGSYGSGSTGNQNRFFPVPGNHDWDSQTELDPYLDYFDLPKNDESNNEEYYDFVWGDIHFFMIDSDPRQADGIEETSAQALWVKDKMLNSTAKWKIAVLHRPPYHSSGANNYSEMRWPFKSWGADAVLSGHKHNYERLIVDDMLYFINGLGGHSKQSFDNTETGSILRYKDDYGAMLVEANSGAISFAFYTKSNSLIDIYEIDEPTPVELTSFTAILNDNSIEVKWKTETELNNYGFYIERAVENSDWSVLSFVEGNGNSNSPNYYSFSDSYIFESGNYNYRLRQTDNDGTFEYSDVVTVTVGVPVLYSLSQNYPNPFNPETRIDYTLPEQQNVSLKVYNMLGEMVQELVNEVKPAGNYTVTFDGSDLPSGVYVYRIRTEGFSENKKMTLLK
ncbi:MAG: metallophosphoesterase [Ignavibacteriaceae bacterium]